MIVSIPVAPVMRREGRALVLRSALSTAGQPTVPSAPSPGEAQAMLDLDFNVGPNWDHG